MKDNMTNKQEKQQIIENYTENLDDQINNQTFK